MLARKIRLLFYMFLIIFAISCTTTPKIFQTDPVGASLYSMKSVYEGTVRSVGQAYIANQLTLSELQAFTLEARRFHASYNVILNLHEAKALLDPEVRIEQLRKSLDALQKMAQELLLKKRTFYIEDIGQLNFSAA